MGDISQMDWEEIRRWIGSLHLMIRDKVLGSMADQAEQATMSDVMRETEADAIYRVDQLVEEPIHQWFMEHWPSNWPVELVIEGSEHSGSVTYPEGTSVDQTVLKCILDPIDGTRNIMYDKRSAWILTGVAPQNGSSTNLQDIQLAMMTEIPTTRQWRSDQISAIRGRGWDGIQSVMTNILTEEVESFDFTPSRAKDFEHGFASLARFFPEGKSMISEIEERLWDQLGLHGRERTPLIFDDQYICSGGQIYELLIGHDRMHGDIRPQVLRQLGLSDSICCHPYDVCTSLILTEAGGVFEQPDGTPVTVPLDTTTPVTWIGYANPTLADQVRPIMKELIKEI